MRALPFTLAVALCSCHLVAANEASPIDSGTAVDAPLDLSSDGLLEVGERGGVIAQAVVRRRASGESPG